MYKIVIHTKYGGFNLSKLAKDFLLLNEIDPETVSRHDSALVKCVEKMGDKAGKNLKIVEIQSRIYKIEEYDGMEQVVTLDDHRNWCIID